MDSAERVPDRAGCVHVHQEAWDVWASPYVSHPLLVGSRFESRQMKAAGPWEDRRL